CEPPDRQAGDGFDGQKIQIPKSSRFDVSMKPSSGRKDLATVSATSYEFVAGTASWAVIAFQFLPARRAPTDELGGIARIPARSVPENAIERVLVRLVLFVKIQLQRFLGPE